MDKDALRQCELIQNMIEISISSLQGLRTKCAALSDLTQKEIRTLEVQYGQHSHNIHFDSYRNKLQLIGVCVCLCERERQWNMTLFDVCCAHDIGY